MLTKIRAYLNGVITLDGLVTEGTRFEPSPTSGYIKTKLQPARAVPANLGGTRTRYTGLFRLDVFEPRSSGVTSVEEKADALIALYQVGQHVLETGEVLVVEAVWQEALDFTDPARIRAPVFVQWFTIA